MRRSPFGSKVTEHQVMVIAAHWLTGARDRDGGKKDSQHIQSHVAIDASSAD